MDVTTWKIRIAQQTDVPALLQIYTPYVETTPITFDYEPPTAEEFGRRMVAIQEKYPYLV